MKILFIRNAGRISGSETYDINLFKELKENSSLEIYFLTNLTKLAEKVQSFGVIVRVISWGEEGVGTKRQLLRVIFKVPLIILRYFFIIHSMEIEQRFDIVCLQSMTEKLFLTIPLKVMRHKVIWTELGPIYSSQMSKVVTFLYRVTSIFVDKIITISRDTKKDLLSGGVKNNKIIVIYIGIDTNKFKPLSKNTISRLRKNINIKPESTVLGFLGTVTNEKGIEDFVKLSKILLGKNGNFHFLVIGDGPFLSWVKDSIQTLKIVQSYTLCGFIDDVREYLGIIDILFLPTRHYEGLSLAILEAQTMSKVVITSDMGGNPEIIKNGVNGFIYKKINNFIIAKLINSLYINKPAMVNLGSNARENIEKRFNIQTQARRFVSLFEKL